MRDLVLIAGGIVCLASGLVFLPLPTPFGLPLLLAGIALILAGSAIARQLMKRFRANNARAHRWISRSERYLPLFLRWPLRQTRPDSIDQV